MGNTIQEASATSKAVHIGTGEVSTYVVKTADGFQVCGYCNADAGAGQELVHKEGCRVTVPEPDCDSCHWTPCVCDEYVDRMVSGR